MSQKKKKTLTELTWKRHEKRAHRAFEWTRSSPRTFSNTSSHRAEHHVCPSAVVALPPSCHPPPPSWLWCSLAPCNRFPLLTPFVKSVGSSRLRSTFSSIPCHLRRSFSHLTSPICLLCTTSTAYRLQHHAEDQRKCTRWCTTRNSVSTTSTTSTSTTTATRGPAVGRRGLIWQTNISFWRNPTIHSRYIRCTCLQR
jgi:hypothetical protein